MKHFLLSLTLLLLLGLVTACGGGSSQPEVEPAQAAPVQAAAAQPETSAAEVLPPAAEKTQPEPAAAAALPAAPVKTEPEVAAPIFEPQSNSEKAVTVQVTPLNLPGGDTLEFEVAFTTHTVNLNFDPAQISILRDDQGREFPATGWDGSAPGGHHRSGVLKFGALETAPAFVEVVIRDVAGVPERVFRWELNS